MPVVAVGRIASVAIARGCGTSPNFNCGANTNIGDNQWHFVVTAWDGTDSYVYIDGVQRAQCSGNDFPLDTTRVSIGARPDQDSGNSPYTGQVDEVQIYNRALATGDVTALHNAGVSGIRGCAPPPAKLIDWYPAAGNTNDIIGGENGVVEGSVAYAPGVAGLALNFASSGDVALSSLPSLKTDLGTQFTVSFWMNWNGTS